MTSSGLLSAVQAAFAMASQLGYNSNSKAHDVYEGYVLTLFLRAATHDGWTWILRDGKNQHTSRAVFRLGPGRLYSTRFTHILLTNPRRPDLEAHIGVKVSGVSSVRHEFDLLVLRSADADACRRTKTDPDQRQIIVHAESKYYGGNLPLPIGRSVVGLAVDCSLGWPRCRFGKSMLITNQKGPSVRRLVCYYGVRFGFSIHPSNPRGEHYLIQHFRALL